jgi:FkbM family methyltransferase
MNIRVRRPFSRRERLRELLLAKALRSRRMSPKERPTIAIIGEHVSDVIRAEGLYERDILQFLKDHVLDPVASKDQVALDVGANIGNHSMVLADIFKAVISFEPNPITNAILHLNLDLNGIENVDVRPLALSSHSGRELLHFGAANLGAAHLGSVGKSEAGRTAEVELAVGDEVLADIGPIGFVKIDVEGAELGVLSGLQETLRRDQPIIVLEQLPGEIDGATGSSPSTNFLKSLGYTMWQIRKLVPARGLLGEILSLTRGSVDFELKRVNRLEKQQYPALLFTPSSYRTPAGSYR